MAMFESFETKRVALPEAQIHAVVGGSGPPLLLLHGHPQTHAMWHKIAPRLAERFTVVASDLRGYGDSSKPAGRPDHSNYSKRAMALDQVDLMQALGFSGFRVLAHDRGARVAHRLALDHPERVSRMVLLDIAPTLAMYERTTMDFARAYFHWFFLIQPAPYPETLLGADVEFHMRSVMGGRHAGLAAFAPEAWAEYVRCARDPATIHGWCEDYRAAASIDLELDRADRDRGHRVACPILVLWGGHGVIERCFAPLDEWRRVAADVRGRALACGHYIAEEAPRALLDEVLPFLESA
jgi:haloacetate dehalogenase